MSGHAYGGGGEVAPKSRGTADLFLVEAAEGIWEVRSCMRGLSKGPDMTVDGLRAAYTSKAEAEAFLTGYEAGADDYFD